MGKHKKHIILAAMLALFSTSINMAEADSLSNLLQMDVKRSSVANTVDVTFYTTGAQSNSVVTRKGNNRYVVLLPNTSSTASVAPGIGGVKDLITDVNVKHVDDGIGGYTKVTFGTTKPINIKTHMKKTSPLTQAQKDSQAIIAKNNVKPQTTQTTQPKATTQAASKPVASKPVEKAKPKVEPKTTQTQPKQVQKPSAPIKAAAAPKPVTQKAPAQPKVETKQKVEAPKVNKTVKSQPKVEKVATNDSNTFVPKMKFDENGKRIIDLEPRVSHEFQSNKNENVQAKVDPLFNVENNVEKVETLPPVEEVETAVETPVSENTNNSTHHKMIIWVLIAGGVAAAASILYLIFDAMKHASDKDQTRLESFYKMSSKNSAKRRRKEYYEIVNNEDLSWQEKYKLYSEKEDRRKPKKNESAMSYVTDMSGLKKAIIEPETQETKQSNNKIAKELNLDIPDSKITEAISKHEKTHEEIVREKLQAKISQMEHSLAQASMQEPEEVSEKVKSEDKSIMSKFSGIKLKSFSKPLSLKESQRSLVEDDKKLSRNKSYKEGRFVKLKNSPLSVNKRESLGSDLKVSDLIGTGSKYLTNNGVIRMSKENEKYLMSSLNSFLSMVDTDSSSTATVSRVDSSAQLKSSSEAMSRSGVTNPIAKASNPMNKLNSAKPSTYMNGLIVKSGYNIDAEKGFYVVNIDGVSALVGRIRESIFVLKKFDHVVDKPLQVRQDDANVYIVRVGKFKCLVDVSKEKMGTLIEI